MRAVNSQTAKGRRPTPFAVPAERPSTTPCFMMTARQIYRQTYMAYPHKIFTQFQEGGGGYGGGEQGGRMQCIRLTSSPAWTYSEDVYRRRGRRRDGGGGGGGAVDLNIYNAAPLSLTTPFRCFSGNSSRRRSRSPHRHRHRLKIFVIKSYICIRRKERRRRSQY